MKRKINLLALALLSFSITACAKTDTAAVNASNSDQQGSTVQVAQLSGSTIGTYQKPGAPVQLSYTTSKVNVGNESTVHITLNTVGISDDVEHITLSVKAGDALLIGGLSSTTWNIPLEANKVNYPVTFTATSSSTGRHYINVFAKVVIGGNTLSRAFAVPVQMGSDAALKAQQTKPLVKRDATGRAIAPMAAQETIH